MGIAADLLEGVRSSNPTGNLYAPTQTAIQKLPPVSDPDAALSNLSREQYNNYVANFSSFEDELLTRATTDTSLIDQARLDAPRASKLAGDIASRDANRYGVALSPAQQAEMNRSLKRGGALNYSQTVNDAYLAQDTLNSELAANIIDIGQGVQSTASSNLATSAANQNSLNQAYQNAKTSQRNSTISNAAGLGSLALMALAV